MLRLFTFLSALFLASAAAATTLWVDAPRDGFLNLRSGPSTGYYVIDQMPHGSKVHVLATPGKWYKVRHETGSVGWAHSSFLSSHWIGGHDRDGRGWDHGRGGGWDRGKGGGWDRGKGDGWGHGKGHGKGQPYWIDAPRHGYLNLRAGPSRHDPVIGRMPHGDRVQVFRDEGRWVKLRHDGQVGWAHRRFLSEHKVRTGHGKPHGQPTGQDYWVYAPGYGGLNLRTGPGTTYGILMTMDQRDKVTELGRQGDWILIRHGSGATGWAHGDYLVKQDPGFVPDHRGGKKGGHKGGQQHGRDGGKDWNKGSHKGGGHDKKADNLAQALLSCVGRDGRAFESCVLSQLGF